MKDKREHSEWSPSCKILKCPGREKAHTEIPHKQSVDKCYRKSSGKGSWEVIQSAIITLTGFASRLIEKFLKYSSQF